MDAIPLEHLSRRHHFKVFRSTFHFEQIPVSLAHKVTRRGQEAVCAPRTKGERQIPRKNRRVFPTGPFPSLFPAEIPQPSALGSVSYGLQAGIRAPFPWDGSPVLPVSLVGVAGALSICNSDTVRGAATEATVPVYRSASLRRP